MIYSGFSTLDAFLLLRQDTPPLPFDVRVPARPLVQPPSPSRCNPLTRTGHCSHLDIQHKTHAQKIYTRRLTLDAFIFMIFFMLDASLTIMN